MFMNYRFVKYREFNKPIIHKHIGLLNIGHLSHFKGNNNNMCKQVAMRWLFCNKVNTDLLITVDLLAKK